jgi:hypothetical protein
VRDGPTYARSTSGESEHVREVLSEIDGFRSVERFESCASPGKFIVIGFSTTRMRWSDSGTYLAGAGGLGWFSSPRGSVTGARRWTPVTVAERYIAKGRIPLLLSRRPMPMIVANTTIPRRSITAACSLSATDSAQ